MGRDLKQYLGDWFQIEKRYYRKVGKVVAVDEAIVFRYSAHDGEDTEIFPALYTGADVLTLHGDKILTRSDFYCSPDQADLEEVARLAQHRHGESRYAYAGLSAGKSALVRRKLARLIESNSSQVRAEFTIAQLATKIDCTVDHLFQVINAEYGLHLDENTDQHRAAQVRDMLRGADAEKPSLRY